IVMSEGKIRPLLQREIVVGDSLIVLAGYEIGPAPDIENASVIGIELKSLVVGLHRLVEIALLDERFAAHGIRDRDVLGSGLALRYQSLAGVLPRLDIVVPRTARRDVVAELRLGQHGTGEDAEKDERETKRAPHRIAPARLVVRFQ